ncbi:hypothetical protein JTB14_029680 [Gonioctena quinquepunctata]|nr:hypothetical protein JTB14_029680 [Gonioctena quinquepunctata]
MSNSEKVKEFYTNDIVYRFDKHKKIIFGVVMDSYEASAEVDEYSSLQKGQIRVLWNNNSREQVWRQSKVRLLNRSIIPGDIVRRLEHGKETQRGYCKEAKQIATVQIVGTDKVVEHVASERLHSVRPYDVDDAVCLGSKFGRIEVVEQMVSMQSKCGSIVDVLTSINHDLDDYWLSKRNRISFDAYYPGQELICIPSNFEQPHWIKKSKIMKRNIQTRQRFTVQNVEDVLIEIAWYSNTSGYSHISEIPKEDIKKLKVLEHPSDTFLELSDRRLLKLSAADVLLKKKDWIKKLSASYRSDIPKVRHIVSVNSKIMPRIPKIRSSSIVYPPSEADGEEEEWWTEEAEESDDDGSCSSQNTCVPTSKKRHYPPKLRDLVPGNTLPVEVISVESKVTVVWQDGTEEKDIPSIQLYYSISLDDHEFFPGEWVVSDNDKEEEMNKYGVIQNVNYLERTACIKWFTYTENEKKPGLLAINEMSVYDLKKHSKFVFRPRSIVKSKPAQEEKMGKVIDSCIEGHVKVQWLNGSEEKCWPQDIELIPEAADYDYSEEESSEEDAAGVSWETESIESYAGDLTDETVLQNMAARLDFVRNRIIYLKEAFKQHTITENISVIGKMAGSITSPEGFNFADPDSWPQWKKRFIRYVTVAGFGSKKDPEKIDLLLYLMGEKADETLLTFETVPTAYTEMLKLFDKHFVPQKNEVFERFKFNSRVQIPGEGIDSFITALHTLAEHCYYGTLKDQLIRDRILVGMLDSETSSRLQLKKGLTLATTIDTVKQVELQAARNIVLRQEGRVNRVQFKGQDRAQSHQQVRSSGREAPRQNMQQAQGAVHSAESIWCGNCGLKRHPRSECPARNSACNKCQRKGHWARKCRQENKAVRTIEDVGVEDGSEPYEDQLFVGSIQKSSGQCLDSLSYGLGACLMQYDENINVRQIVAFASRSLSPVEKLYAQIEKETLAATYAAERFSEFITGSPKTLEVDHKPLMQILQTKALDDLTPRKDLAVADALSWAPIEDSAPKQDELMLETDAHVRTIIETLPIKDKFLEQIMREQQRILAYRSTPLACGFSPAELLMSRKLRTNLPVLPNKLNSFVDTSQFIVREEEGKRQEEKLYNSRHSARNLPDLSVGDPVWVLDIRQYGVIVDILREPRSYNKAAGHTNLMVKFVRNQSKIVELNSNRQERNKRPREEEDSPRQSSSKCNRKNTNPKNWNTNGTQNLDALFVNPIVDFDILCISETWAFLKDLLLVYENSSYLDKLLGTSFFSLKSKHFQALLVQAKEKAKSLGLDLRGRLFSSDNLCPSISKIKVAEKENINKMIKLENKINAQIEKIEGKEIVAPTTPLTPDSTEISYISQENLCVELLSMLKIRMDLAYAEIISRIGGNQAFSVLTKASENIATPSSSTPLPSCPTTPEESFSILSPLRPKLSETDGEENEPYAIIEDAPVSHHYFSTKFEPTDLQRFLKAVQKEYKLMKESLPHGVWVRSYGNRIDLLSVMIKGPAKTPYEDGLFLFDIQLSSDYPRSPPLVHYISYSSERLNPNLYVEGKVCVSLLGTWMGRGTEVWGPNSTLLQLIVSIQGLILVAEPYYNEAGYEKQTDTQQGYENSRTYNELVILKMVQSMKEMLFSPPEIFRQEIFAHFSQNGQQLCDRLNRYCSENDPLAPDFPLLPVSKGLKLSLSSSLSSFQAVLNKIGDRSDIAKET